MTFTADLRAHLLADATIAGLVGERIYPVVRPETSPLPAITYQIVTDDAMTSLSGLCGLSNVRVQIDCWSLSYETSNAIGIAVRDRMFVAAETFRTARADGQDVFEDDTRIRRRSLDFSVWYSEP